MLVLYIKVQVHTRNASQNKHKIRPMLRRALHNFAANAQFSRSLAATGLYTETLHKETVTFNHCHMFITYRNPQNVTRWSNFKDKSGDHSLPVLGVAQYLLSSAPLRRRWNVWRGTEQGGIERRGNVQRGIVSSPLIRRPRSLCSLWNFAVKLTMRKLEWWGYFAVKVLTDPPVWRRDRRTSER